MHPAPLLFVAIIAVSGCGARATYTLSQAQIDQAKAEQEGRAYRGPGAGPEMTPEQYAHSVAVPTPTASKPTGSGLPGTGARSRISDAAAIARSKKAVADTLRDPLSAQFRDVRVSGHCDGVKHITGFVNAKNGYSGYSGFMVFTTRVGANRTVVTQSGGLVYATPEETRAAAVCRGDAA